MVVRLVAMRRNMHSVAIHGVRGIRRANLTIMNVAKLTAIRRNPRSVAIGGDVCAMERRIAIIGDATKSARCVA